MAATAKTGLIGMLLLGLAACGGQAERELRLPPRDALVTVAQVIDGDTLEVVDPAGQRYTIRLRGADAPETGQPYGEEARRCLHSLVAGQSLRLSFDMRARDDLLIGDLYRDTQSVSLTLVKWGCAWWDQQSAPYDLEMGGTQNRARKARRGLWAGSAPVPPWEWRSRNT